MTEMKFPKKLKFLIDHRGTSQAEVARKIGVQEARISEWIAGKGPMLSRSLVLGLGIARALDVPMEYLADEAAGETPPDVPLRWETLVREIAGRKGWEWVYWRLIEGQSTGDPIGYADPTRKDVKKSS